MSRGTASTTGALAVGTTVVFNGRNTLNSIQVSTDGVNNATCTVFDNTAASGKVLAILTVLGANLNGGRSFDNALRAENGLTVVVAGTGATAYISFGAT